MRLPFGLTWPGERALRLKLERTEIDAGNLAYVNVGLIHEARALKEALWLARGSGFTKAGEGEGWIEVNASEVLTYDERRTGGRQRLYEIEASIQVLWSEKFEALYGREVASGGGRPLSQRVPQIAFLGLGWTVANVQATVKLEQRGDSVLGGPRIATISMVALGSGEASDPWSEKP